jgi:hypothetical protein
MLFSPFFTKTCHVHGISGNICYERNIIWILALKIAHVKYFKTLPLRKDNIPPHCTTKGADRSECSKYRVISPYFPPTSCVSTAFA